MKFTAAVGQQIINAIRAKMPGMTLGPCPLCRTAAWELLDAFVSITISPEPQNVHLGGQILPNAVLVCTNCGNTHLLNLNRLGLAHLLTPEEQAPVQLPEVPQEPPGGLASPEAPSAASLSDSSVLEPAPRKK